MKGQYFSFDAIIATVIMVIAITSLVAYWFGTQSVIESRISPMYSDSLRIAESLLSPGNPQDWESAADLSGARQIGLTAGFSNELNRTKLDRMKTLIGIGTRQSDFEANYNEIGKMMRATGNYYILVEQTDDRNGVLYEFGKRQPANATEVVVAHRGATLDGMPMRLRVFLWR